MKYGRSLSFCVRDILLGNVKLEDVGAIVASTKMENLNDLTEVFNSYSESYWSEFSRAKSWKIVYYLWTAGKIYQPRLNKSMHQALYKYPIWASSFEDAYKSLEEING